MPATPAVTVTDCPVVPLVMVAFPVTLHAYDSAPAGAEKTVPAVPGHTTLTPEIVQEESTGTVEMFTSF